MKHTIAVTGANGALGSALVREATAQGASVVSVARRATAEPAELHLVADLATDEGLSILRDAPIPALNAMFLCAAQYADPKSPRQASAGPLMSLELPSVASVLMNTVLPTLSPLIAWMDLLLPGSVVIAVSSSASSLNSGVRDYPRYGYGMAKAAVNRLVVEAAAELKGRSVAVCAVDPGWFRSSMGGDQAPRSADGVAVQLLDLAHRIDVHSTGSLLNLQGEVLPW